MCHIRERNTPKYYQLVSWGRGITDELREGLLSFYVFFKFSTMTLFLWLAKKKKKKGKISKQLGSNKLTFYSHHPRVS